MLSILIISSILGYIIVAAVATAVLLAQFEPVWYSEDSNKDVLLVVLGIIWPIAIPLFVLLFILRASQMIALFTLRKMNPQYYEVSFPKHHQKRLK